MSLQSQHRRYALLSGILGWVWLLCIPWWLWFLGTAIFGDGSWARFFAALAVGFIAKNMVRGFEAHKRRVALEAQLVDKGMDRETARELGYAAMNGGESGLTKRMQELGIH